MRVVLSVLLLAAMGLAGCADYPELDGLIAPEQPDDGNTTSAPQSVVVEVARELPSEFPAVSIATAAYTAPVPIELDRVEGDAATMTLVAEAEGLRCIAVPHDDPMASPAGYKAVAAWASCSLSADGVEFTSGQRDSLAADIPLMQDIPVEDFTWNMTLGRVLVNNTGEHEQVMDSIEREQTAAPSIQSGHHMIGQPWWGHVVCDTWLDEGIATVFFETVAHNGRALLSVDVAGFDVLHVEGSGAPVQAANGTLDGIEASWWQDNGTLVAIGAWEHQSTAWLDITIHFRGHENHLGFVAPHECPGAVFIDVQTVPFEAQAIGIAAGWKDSRAEDVFVEVWHSP